MKEESRTPELISLVQTRQNPLNDPFITLVFALLTAQPYLGMRGKSLNARDDNVAVVMNDKNNKMDELKNVCCGLQCVGCGDGDSL